MNTEIFVYILVMAAVTYAIRAIPMVLIRKKIENRFLVSFLYYVPYVTLAAMTVPAVFYATQNWISAALAMVVAVTVALIKSNLVLVAASACITVFVTEFVISIL